MPHLQKLYEKIKGRDDIQIVTINVDDNVGLVGPFLAENKYTFPVVPGHFLMQQLVPMLAIPLNWIVDASGEVRYESVGFGGDGDTWAEEILAIIDKLKAKSGT